MKEQKTAEIWPDMVQEVPEKADAGQKTAQRAAVVKSGTSKKGTNSELKNGKKVINLPSDNNMLYQPLALTLLSYRPTVIGNRVILAIVRKLQSAFVETINEHHEKKTDWRQLDIFKHSDQSDIKIMDDDEVVFEIHMSELVDDCRRYQEAFNEVFKFSSVIVNYSDTVKNKDGSVDTFIRSGNLFDAVVVDHTEIETVKGKNGAIVRKYKNRKPVVALAFKRSMANRIFSFGDKYGDFLEMPVMKSNDKYFARIYIYLSAYKRMDNPVLEVAYDDFRMMIDIGRHDDPTAIYPVYKDFYRRVIEPSRQEMLRLSEAGQCDIWFEMEKRSKNGRKAATPDTLVFTIHLSELGKGMKGKKRERMSEAMLSDRLRTEFAQTATQAAGIVKLCREVPDGVMEAKLDELKRLKDEGKISIATSASSYYNKTIVTFLEQERDKARAAKVAEEAAGADGSTTPVNDGEAVPHRTEATGEAAGMEAAADELPAAPVSKNPQWRAVVEQMRREVDESTFARLIAPIHYKRCFGSLLELYMPSDTRRDELLQSLAMHTLMDVASCVFGVSNIEVAFWRAIDKP